VTVCTGQTVQPEDLPPEVLAGHHLAPPPVPAPRLDPAAPAEAAALRAALEAHRWSRAATAQALGLSRSTLWRRMRSAGLA
jgi:transcriptional regulator of acetoin/glycerol metabolism